MDKLVNRAQDFVAQERKRKAFDNLRREMASIRQHVWETMDDYDRSGDHSHAGSPKPGDCLRCKLQKIYDILAS